MLVSTRIIDRLEDFALFISQSAKLTLRYRLERAGEDFPLLVYERDAAGSDSLFRHIAVEPGTNLVYAW